MCTNPNMKPSFSAVVEAGMYVYSIGAKMQVIPVRSPDLNPIKNLFNIVRKCIEAEILEQNKIHQSWDEFVEKVKFHVWSVSRE